MRRGEEENPVSGGKRLETDAGIWDNIQAFEIAYGDVPKWLKGPHSKCGRRVTPCESSNLSISAKSEQSSLCSDLFFEIPIL